MQCIFLENTVREPAYRYACITGPADYNPTEEDIKDYCTSIPNDQSFKDFLHCPRYQANLDLNKAKETNQ